MYNIINFVISFGAMQGLIIGVFLLVKGLKLKQDFFYLALILIGFAALLGRVVAIGLYDNQPWFFNNLNFFLLISPALYLYAKESSGAIKNPLNFSSLHFLPFLIINLVFIVYYFSLKNPIDDKTYLTNIIKLNDRFSIIYFSIYLYLTYKTVRLYKSSYRKELYELLNKLVYNFLCFFIIWLIYVLAELIYFDYTMELIYYYPIMIIMAVTIYYMSLQFITNYRFLFDIKSITKRKKITLDETDGKNLLNQLTLFMNEEKPYLDGAISLTTLAGSLNVNPKALSFVINEYLHKNFNHYINDWRIEEVKKRLNNEEYDKFKMLTIAFDCGFNSKSTFNLAFKKATGLSPSEYRKL
ncbi:helix-turn-helix domain-containing protein [Aquimarina litoralis]|uniref:helix-turn-helix domain-containing protein n=1 Tax=Aquimarina litoralis TaxID=584605 RepID=UPI001C57B2E5|nr:helix-turn-helix domain-containing protein [Aquimarina litoralis]